MNPDNGQSVPDLNASRPFGRTAKAYKRAGWNPIPLPPREKFPPPTGWTGGDAPDVSDAQIALWGRSGKGKGNVGLHLSDVVLDSDGGGEGGDESEDRLTVVGIDVDDYGEKTGGETLRQAEAELGVLPPTWTSSARSDGVSGIRFFLAPAGLEYSGKLGKSVEVIQKKHRFAVVWPSLHPEAEEDGVNGGRVAAQYRWFRPGCAPTGPIDSVVGSAGPGAKMSSLIPRVDELAALPDKWVDALSKGRTALSGGGGDRKAEGRVDEIDEWARSVAGRGAVAVDGSARATGALCKQMKKRLETALSEETGIGDISDSHTPFLNAHWSILRAGVMEGHAGWLTAAEELENRFVELTVAAGKRGLEEVRGEIFRSRINALRRLKADAERNIESGVFKEEMLGVQGPCSCFDGGAGSGEESGAVRDPRDYEMNDDGNAEHLNDLFPDCLKWVRGYDEWIVWEGAKSRWFWEEDGGPRRMWWIVKKRQTAYAEQLLERALAAAAADDPSAKEMMKEAGEWRGWARKSGNNSQAEEALKALKAREGIQISSDKLDCDDTVLGVENGLIELTPDGACFRERTKADMVLRSCAVPYVPLDGQVKAGGAARGGVSLWLEHLETVFPDRGQREWFQQVMGMCLLGRNVKKKLIFLNGERHTGKSTTINAITNALGSYSVALSMNIFNDRDLNPQLANALSARVAVIAEAGGSSEANVEMLKKISGNDVVSAERKNSNEAVSRVAAFTPIFTSNDPPILKRKDEALKDRMLVIPFSQKLKPSEKGGTVETECAMAVLAWLVDGWNLFCERGLEDQPVENYLFAAEFSAKMSPVGAFLDDEIEKTGKGLDENGDPTKSWKSGDWVTNQDMYVRYRQWCEANGEKILSSSILGKELSSYGLKAVPRRVTAGGSSVRVIIGVKLRNRAISL